MDQEAKAFRIMLWSAAMGGPMGGFRKSMAWIERARAGGGMGDVHVELGAAAEGKARAWVGLEMEAVLGVAASRVRELGVLECVGVAEPFSAGSPEAQSAANSSMAWALARRARAQGGGAPLWESRRLDKAWVGPEAWKRLEAMLVREALMDASAPGSDARGRKAL